MKQLFPKRLALILYAGLLVRLTRRQQLHPGLSAAVLSGEEGTRV